MGSSDWLDSIEIWGCLKVRLGLAHRTDSDFSTRFSSALWAHLMFFFVYFFELCESREDKSAHGQFSFPPLPGQLGGCSRF